MLLDEPICCQIYGALTFDGLAIDHEERVHLVVRTAAARAYLGPDGATVARRAHILVVALVDSGVIRSDRAAGIAGWLGECWSAAAEEIRIAATTLPTDREPDDGQALRGRIDVHTPAAEPRVNPGLHPVFRHDATQPGLIVPPEARAAAARRTGRADS
jgi:hypothetical protein